MLRAGHLRAGSDYAVERRSSPGHDLLFCVAGAGAARVGGRAFPVGKGELAWINGYEPHAHRADAADPWELLWLRMDGPGLEALRRLLGADENPVFRFDDPAKVRAGLRHIGHKPQRIKVFKHIGDAASEHDMDFDWADETIHAGFGKKWLQRIMEIRGEDPENYDKIRDRCGELVQAVVQTAQPAEVAELRQIVAAIIAKAERGAAVAA